MFGAKNNTNGALHKANSGKGKNIAKAVVLIIILLVLVSESYYSIQEEGPRSGRSQAGDWGQVSRDAGSGVGGIPGREIPTVYRPFLPQCVFCDAALQGETGS